MIDSGNLPGYCLVMRLNTGIYLGNRNNLRAFGLLLDPKPMSFEPVSEAERKRVASLVAAHGECWVAQRLGMTKASLLRIICRTNVRPGSVALLRLGLAALDAEAGTAATSATR